MHRSLAELIDRDMLDATPAPLLQASVRSGPQWWSLARRVRENTLFTCLAAELNPR
jgi:hypothetical protein